MSTSKLQRKCSSKLSFYFARYIIRENSRPEWCLGDDFERLELDFYLPELNVAVEVQGDQHYRFSPHFHATYDDFLAQQRRDEAKKRRCADYAITLIEVVDELSLEDAMEELHRIAHAYEVRVKKPVSPDEWCVILKRIHGTILYLWNHRTSVDRNSMFIQFGNRKAEVLRYSEIYGMEIFSNVEPETAQSLFQLIQRMSSWHLNIRKKNKAKKHASRTALIAPFDSGFSADTGDCKADHA